jgi:hypothetical protein
MPDILTTWVTDIVTTSDKGNQEAPDGWTLLVQMLDQLKSHVQF